MDKFTEALEALRLGDIEKAHHIFDDLLREDPNNEPVLRNLAGIFARLGNQQEALQYFLRAYALRPDDPYLWVGIGLAYAQLGDREKAMEYLQKTEKNIVPEELQQVVATTLLHLLGSTATAELQADAITHMTSALLRLGKLSPRELQQIAREMIAIGQQGIGVNDAAQRYRITSLEGDFSGLEALCYLYVSVRMAFPAVAIGLDLSKEFELAKGMLFAPPDLAELPDEHDL